MTFKKLSDFKGKAAWNAMADLMEPLSEIFKDKEISEKAKDKTDNDSDPDDKKNLAEIICRNHSDSATKILAVLAGTDYETFKEQITLPVLFLGILTIMGDPELINLFISQGLTIAETSSGSATENIEAKKE